jgi:hypothetical protein
MMIGVGGMNGVIGHGANMRGGNIGGSGNGGTATTHGRMQRCQDTIHGRPSITVVQGTIADGALTGSEGERIVRPLQKP